MRTVSDPPTHDSLIYPFIDYIFIQCTLHVRYCFGTQDVAINQSNKALALKELIFYGGRQTVNKYIFIQGQNLNCFPYSTPNSSLYILSSNMWLMLAL